MCSCSLSPFSFASRGGWWRPPHFWSSAPGFCRSTVEVSHTLLYTAPVHYCTQTIHPVLRHFATIIWVHSAVHRRLCTRAVPLTPITSGGLQALLEKHNQKALLMIRRRDACVSAEFHLVRLYHQYWCCARHRSVAPRNIPNALHDFVPVPRPGIRCASLASDIQQGA